MSAAPTQPAVQVPKTESGTPENPGVETAANISTESSAAKAQQPKAFDEQGVIGKQFTEEGSVGKIGQTIGGPLSSEGVVGKQFTTEGAIGGTVQSAMGGKKEL